MDDLMVLNNKKEEVEEEVEEETDDEEDEEIDVEEFDLSREISFLNLYIPTINDDELKATFTRRLDLLHHLYSMRC